jgi:hypothetical protein
MVETPGMLGDWARSAVAAARSARSGVAEDPENEETWLAPACTPRVPQRLYFKFGAPVRLTPELYSDKEQCEQVRRRRRERGPFQGGGYWHEEREGKGFLWISSFWWSAEDRCFTLLALFP